jgi:hypothetical protein
MATTSAKMQKKSLDSSPDETRTFEKGKIDVANLGDITTGRAIFEPGWSWEKCVKPIAKTTKKCWTGGIWNYFFYETNGKKFSC